MAIFEGQKKRALERLRRRGADEEVEGLLQKMNSLDGFFTTSSCSGRIALICLPEIGAKREARFIGRWHRPVRQAEVLAALSDASPSLKDEISHFGKQKYQQSDQQC